MIVDLARKMSDLKALVHTSTAYSHCYNQVKLHADLNTAGSEIHTSSDFEWSKRGWFENGPDLK